MRIISDQRDYYDCVQALGQDQSLIYVRKPYVEILSTSPFSIDALRRGYWFCDSLVRGLYFVGFCGTVYPALLVEDPSNPRNRRWCYTLEEVDTFVRDTFKPKLVERYFSGPRYYWRETWRHIRHSQFAEFFRFDGSKYVHLFKEPIFVAKIVHETQITYNANLGDLRFYRVVDPYTAYQEIQMWLSNVAKVEKPIPRIDDKTMAACKGFDKWSFRKEPFHGR